MYQQDMDFLRCLEILWGLGERKEKASEHRGGTEINSNQDNTRKKGQTRKSVLRARLFPFTQIS